MKRYLFSAFFIIIGVAIGAGFQQLRIDEQKAFWQNSLTRYNLLATAYRNVCLPLKELEEAVEDIGLEADSISESDDARSGLVFVQTGFTEPFTKDLGNMKFYLNDTHTCVTIRPGE